MIKPDSRIINKYSLKEYLFA